MKRILILVLAVMSLSASAQIAREGDLFGVWEVESSTGEYNSENFNIERMVFPGNGQCTIYANISRYFDEGPQMVLAELQCNGYMITDYDKLHVFSNRGYDGYSTFMMQNFVIDEFVMRDRFVLTSFNGRSRITMKFADKDPAGIREANMDAGTDSTMYNLQGVPVTSPKGVYIQSGKKQIGK